MIDSSLLHDAIGAVPRLDFAVYHEAAIVDWALPDLVIAFALTNQTASVF